MSQDLDPLDHMFIGPLYRTRDAETRAAIDRLLGIEPGHRNSNQIITGYCQATEVIRHKIEILLGIEADNSGGGRVVRD